MEITLDTRALPSIEAAALVTYAFDLEKPVEGLLSRLDEAAGGTLTKLAASGELTGKMLETTLVHFPQGLAAHRLLVIGAGKKAKLGTADLRRIACAAVRFLKSRQVKSIALLAREGGRSSAPAQAIVE